MNQEELKNIIPHRDAMLLIDEACAIDGVARGERRILGNEWFLQGHFPGNPVVPGVILCEMLAQSACVLLPLEQIRGATPYFAGLNNVRFKNGVKPGDVFKTECRIVKQKPPFIFAKGSGYVEGKLCITAEFSFALIRE